MCKECECSCSNPGDWPNCGYHQAVTEVCPWCKKRVRNDGDHFTTCAKRPPVVKVETKT